MLDGLQLERAITDIAQIYVPDEYAAELEARVLDGRAKYGIIESTASAADRDRYLKAGQEEGLDMQWYLSAFSETVERSHAEHDNTPTAHRCVRQAMEHIEAALRLISIAKAIP